MLIGFICLCLLFVISAATLLFMYKKNANLTKTLEKERILHRKKV